MTKLVSAVVADLARRVGRTPRLEFILAPQHGPADPGWLRKAGQARGERVHRLSFDAEERGGLVCGQVPISVHGQYDKLFVLSRNNRGCAVREIPLGRTGLIAVVDDEDYEMASQYRWHADRHLRTVYARRNIWLGNGRSTSQRLHQLVTGWQLADHIDGDGRNNRRSNLRKATSRQNARNQRPQVGVSSEFKGVSWDRQNRRWEVSIKICGRKRRLGRFDDENEAARVYDAAALSEFGEFARLNFPSLTA